MTVFNGAADGDGLYGAILLAGAADNVNVTTLSDTATDDDDGEG